MELIGCQDLAVPRDVMHHVVHVESSFNPYAIGVVGGRLVRQPRNLPEAVSTARMLERRGYNFSLGLAQVNRHNLAAYGLDSYEKAFQPCANLRAGSRILAECYQRSRDWGKAFSCYYSGDFRTGFRHGYVQKIHASMRGGSKPGAAAAGAAPIAVVDRVQHRVAGAVPTTTSTVQPGQAASAASDAGDGQATSLVARRSGQHARRAPSTAVASDGVDSPASLATMPTTSVSAAATAQATRRAEAMQPATLPANRPIRVSAKRIEQGRPATASRESTAEDSAFVF